MGKTEADIARLIKDTKELAAHLNQNFLQLEATIRRHAQEESKTGADQSEKPTGPGGADGKDTLAGAGDHKLASVDALIAGFKSRSPPRRRHADKSIGLQHVVGTRSAMMTSMLPAPCEQRTHLLLRQKNKIHDKVSANSCLVGLPG